MQHWTAIWAIALLGSSAIATAAEPKVYDNSKFFSEETVKQADYLLVLIQKDFGKDVVVETFETIPQSLRDQFAKQDRRAFFEDWLRSRAKHYGVNGVFILICRDPGRLELEPGMKTRQDAFTLTDRDDAVKVIADDFRKKEFDKGLIDGLELINQRMSRNLGTGSEPQTRPATAPTTRPTTAPVGP